MSFQGQDDLKWPKQHQKLIPHITFSHRSGITHVYTIRNEKVEFSSWSTAAIFDLAIAKFVAGWRASTSVIFHV